MKVYVNREWTGKLKEAVITINDVEELTAIHGGIKLLIKSYEESLEFYNSLLKKVQSDEDRKQYKESIKGYEDSINMLENMEKNLAVKNEIPIEKYNIKKEKVDYAFDFDIGKLSDEEILKKLCSIFPDKRLYMLPVYRGGVNKRMTILGHNGNVVVTYK